MNFECWVNLQLTTVAILTLVLGIGANPAIFTLIDAVMLRTLPIRTVALAACFIPVRHAG